MASAARKVFVVAARRTPFVSYGGALKDLSATDLGVHAARAALASIKFDAKAVDSAVFGNVAQTSSDAAYLARHVALRSDLAVHTPALTVNRLCGSGMQAMVSGYQDIVLGDAEIVLTGGTESMSQAPFAVRNIRFGTQLGTNPPFEDTLWAALSDSYAKVPMGITAENLAEQYKLSRHDVDSYALRSQQRWAAAEQAGIFKREIAPIEVKTKKGHVTLSSDDGPRPETTLEGLTKLKPVFKKDGVVTAGTASGITDGAAAVLIASADAVKKYNLKPLAEIISYHYSGVEPTIMGIGPVPAIQGALKKAKLSLNDIDLVEVNEAFSAQVLAVQRELKIPLEKLNLNGGAISLGHPLGASGARIVGHLTHELQRTGLTYAVGSACIGGGQGIAAILKRV